MRRHFVLDSNPRCFGVAPENSALLSFQNSAIITDVGAKNKTQENR